MTSHVDNVTVATILVCLEWRFVVEMVIVLGFPGSGDHTALIFLQSCPRTFATTAVQSQIPTSPLEQFPALEMQNGVEDGLPREIERHSVYCGGHVTFACAPPQPATM